MKSGEKSGPCGHEHRSGFCFGPLEPDFLATIPEEKREKRVLIDSDLCVVDNRHFFIRGLLPLPILGTAQSFDWLVWVSLSKKNFNRAADLWEIRGREKEPPYFGWLNSRLPVYPETSELKVNVHTLPVGTRPTIKLEQSKHPLSIEQREGITMERAKSLAKQVLIEWT
jgi:hypothetical protein